MRKLLILSIMLLVFPAFCFGADVTLTWDANTEPDLAGYYVYQADRIGDKTTEWVKITPDLVTLSTFTVTGLDGDNYAWLVTAVDLSGNESFVSNMVERFDRTPPIAPANLSK